MTEAIMAQGATIFGCSGFALTPSEAAFFREADPWGFILFARNIDTPDQVRALTADLRSAVGRDAPVLIDQEGGRVQRMGPPHWRQWLPPLDQVDRAGPHAAASLTLRARVIAQELRAVGIDVNCAPTADVANDQTHPFLRNRCLGTDAAQVAINARAMADGFLQGGVLPVLKHLPGHGRATLDSHKALPRVDTPQATLATTDFAAFKPLADLPLAMTAHLLFPDIDPDRPATLSPRLIQLIRDEIGFDGLLMTDDICMGALGGALADRCTAALSAGCDAILHCNGEMAEMQTVAEASGTLSAKGQTRAEAALALRRPPEDADAEALTAQMTALLDPAA
ncbi:glycoside hydrolase family 3 protein [Fluviibacterium sp. DFM31]|uniref:beta-N-acetylhexosaminidase n=1 Tax=Meridianimarinicoccus marinus TaxID=3231483 RepID=A0ABV3L1K4_9RHOB